MEGSHAVLALGGIALGIVGRQPIDHGLRIEALGQPRPGVQLVLLQVERLRVDSAPARQQVAEKIGVERRKKVLQVGGADAGRACAAYLAGEGIYRYNGKGVLCTGNARKKGQKECGGDEMLFHVGTICATKIAISFAFENVQLPRGRHPVPCHLEENRPPYTCCRLSLSFS